MTDTPDPLRDLIAQVLDECRTMIPAAQADAVLSVLRKAAQPEIKAVVLGTTTGPPETGACGGRSVPTYSGQVVPCVLSTGHAGPCQSAAEFPYVAWPNPSHGVWNRDPAPGAGSVTSTACPAATWR